MLNFSTKTKNSTLGILLVALLLVLAGCGSAQVEPSSSTQIRGSSALDFSAELVSGGKFDASTLMDKPSVVWFWTPWCPSCKREAPQVAKVAQQLDGRVNFIGVAGLGERDAMQKFVKDGQVGNIEHVDDVDGQVWEHFGVVAQPAYVFIKKDGTTELVAGALGEKALLERAQALTR